MFCGCALSLRRAAEHAHLPGLPRPARRAAGGQRRGDPLRPDDRARARLRARAAVDLPPQELLLSRPAQGLPDQPVRRAPLPRRAARRRAHPPRAPRGGRGEARPRRRERAHPRRATQRSSTSTAAARRWPRSSPSPTCARPSRRRVAAACCARRCAQLGVSDVNMEEGSLRCDANISIRPAGQRELGTKTELKNMNSFRFLEKRDPRRDRAPGGAAARRASAVVQETLHFDPRTEAITSLRSKEEAHDYRYFPEPDLVPVAITEEMLDRARARRCPSCPAARAERFERELGLCGRQRAAARLARRARRLLRGGAARRRTATPRRAAAARQLGQRARRAASTSRTRPRRKRRSRRRWRRSSAWSTRAQVTQDAAKQVLDTLVAEGGDPGAIVEPRAWARSAAATSSTPIVAAGARRQPGRRREAARAAT